MFDIEVFTKNLLLLWETSSNRLPLFLTVAMSIFLGGLIGAFLVRLLRPREKVLELQLADAQRQLTDSNNSLSCLTQESKTNTIEKLEAQEKNKKFDAVREALFGEEDELWRLHGIAAPINFHTRLANSKPKIVLIANLKGGVGKTTITANLAAYFEKKLNKRVLAIDLDYQGSLSETLLRMAGLDYTKSLADDFIAGNRTGEDLVLVAKQLQPKLSNTRLIPSNYELMRTDNRVMLKWLLKEVDQDSRFNLGEVLLHPAVQNTYDVILIDGPPRLSTAAINAFATCHHLVIPTVPDMVSIPPIKRFMTNIQGVLSELNPGLRRVGIVLNLTIDNKLSPRELDAKIELEQEIANCTLNTHVYHQHIRRLDSLASAAGRDVLYLKSKNFREDYMDKLGAEIAAEIGFGVVK